MFMLHKQSFLQEKDVYEFMRGYQVKSTLGCRLPCISFPRSAPLDSTYFDGVSFKVLWGLDTTVWKFYHFYATFDMKSILAYLGLQMVPFWKLWAWHRFWLAEKFLNLHTVDIFTDNKEIKIYDCRALVSCKVPNHLTCAVFQRNGSNSTHYVAIFCPLISRKLESLAFIMIFLFCSTPEFRNAFLKTIRQIIRDSVRRMNLPVTNSQSYNGNGANSGTAPKRGIIWRHIWQHWIQFHLRYCNRVHLDALRSKCICNAAMSFIHCKLT